jgi:hypothetical protein
MNIMTRICGFAHEPAGREHFIVGMGMKADEDGHGSKANGSYELRTHPHELVVRGSGWGDGANVASCNPALGAIGEKEDAHSVLPHEETTQQSMRRQQHNLPLFHGRSVKWDCQHWPPAFCVVDSVVSNPKCNFRHTWLSLGRTPPHTSASSYWHSATTVAFVVLSSPPGSVRFASGTGLLTVVNDFVVFVSPPGPVAEKWSELVQARATEAEIRSALESDIPPDHHVAVLHLVDRGIAMLAAPGADRITGSLRPAPDGIIRFGMHPGPISGHWLGAGAIGASGFEIDGFALAKKGSRDEFGQDDPPPPSIHTPLQERTPSQPAPPRSEFFSAPAKAPPPPRTEHRSDSPQNVVKPLASEPPILSSPPFSDLPTESDRSDPGHRNLPNPGALSIRFDDGQELSLDHPLAVGRAPEGSAEVPDGAVVVVVSGDQVSRCHFVIRPTATGAEVVDTNSLNGCFLDDSDRPGSGPQIPVGVPVQVESGQQLRFGDRSFTLIAKGRPS